MKKTLLFSLVLLTSIVVHSQQPLPYILDFENAVFPPANCETTPVASSITWQYEPSYSGYGIGNGCMSFDNFNNTSGSYALRLPSMNFSQTALPYIRFDVAYATQPTTINSDVFGIWWSNNGTSNWQNLQGFSGNSLITALPTANVYTPSPADWRTTTFPLTFLAGRPYVRIAVQDDCNNGNKIYIDNIIVFDSATSGINRVDIENSMNIFPNPFINVITIQNKTSKSHTSFELYNLTGEKVISKTLTGLNNYIDLSDYPGGVFLYKIISDDAVKSGKLIRN